jgi:hypothetical protein
MAKVVAIHGVGQQFKGDAIIHREWWPAFLSGLHIAGCDLVDEHEMVCPFYGHLFRPKGMLSISDNWRVSDIEDDESALLEMLWHAAAQIEPESVPSPEEFDCGASLARSAQIVQRALGALSRSRFWTDISEAMLIGDLKQVTRYFREPELREAVLETVLARITADTRVVIGHSLGSVVAYEALYRKPENVVSFISLGSPLGIRKLIFERLEPPRSAMGFGAWPGHVKYWTNIADSGDIVALEKKLVGSFGSQVRDLLVCNGAYAHHGERYLSTKEAGEAACSGLWGRNS